MTSSEDPRKGSTSAPAGSASKSKRTHRKDMRTGTVKGNWTEEEDRKLSSFVQEYIQRRQTRDADLDGSSQHVQQVAQVRWSDISKELPGRIGKQCRERWINHLDPDINKGHWTTEEEVAIYVCWRKWGSQWARISRLLDGRSDNRVKNHWNCHMNRLIDTNNHYAMFLDVSFRHLEQVDDMKFNDLSDAGLRDILLTEIKKYLEEQRNNLPYLSPGSTTNNVSQERKERKRSPSLRNAVTVRRKAKKHKGVKLMPTHRSDEDSSDTEELNSPPNTPITSATPVERDSDSESSDWRENCGVWARSPPRTTQIPPISNPARSSCRCPCHGFVNLTQPAMLKTQQDFHKRMSQLP